MVDLREFSMLCPQIKLQEWSNDNGSEVAESDEFLGRGPVSYETSVENMPVAGSSWGSLAHCGLRTEQ